MATIGAPTKKLGAYFMRTATHTMDLTSLPTSSSSEGSLRDPTALFAHAPDVAEAFPSIDVPATVESATKAAERAAKPISQGSRLVALDAARVFATFGVMWTHVLEVQGHESPVTALGRFGTSFYVIACVFLSTRSAVKHPERSWLSGCAQRAQRLLVPFLLWSAIYAAFYSLRLLPREHIDWAKLSTWWGPFAGCARHLWFLPFAFFASGVASAVVPKMRNWSTRRVVTTILLASGVTYWFFYRVLFFALDRYWLIDWHLHRLDRWIDEIPLVVLAMGAALLLNRRDVLPANAPERTVEGGAGGALASHRALVPGRALVSNTLTLLSRGLAAQTASAARFLKSQKIAPWFVVGFLITQLLYLRGYDVIHEMTHTQGRFMANLAGLCLLGAFLLAQPRRWMARLAPLGRYTYFAFLVHVLVIDWGFWRLSSLPGFGSLAFGFLSTVALFAICVQLGAFVKRIPALSWLTP